MHAGNWVPIAYLRRRERCAVVQIQRISWQANLERNGAVNVQERGDKELSIVFPNRQSDDGFLKRQVQPDTITATRQCNDWLGEEGREEILNHIAGAFASTFLKSLKGVL
ncbi:hypothetical protein SDC9_148010 [bioreactor metagenome]|uniref:Uncharacterized protein n=1 Tax=bioreactor metagenome TaxID=1076179 RepID=A0A645EHR8_9ZZZZ